MFFIKNCYFCLDFSKTSYNATQTVYFFGGMTTIKQKAMSAAKVADISNFRTRGVEVKIISEKSAKRHGSLASAVLKSSTTVKKPTAKSTVKTNPVSKPAVKNQKKKTPAAKTTTKPTAVKKPAAKVQPKAKPMAKPAVKSTVKPAAKVKTQKKKTPAAKAVKPATTVKKPAAKPLVKEKKPVRSAKTAKKYNSIHSFFVKHNTKDDIIGFITGTKESVLLPNLDDDTNREIYNSAIMSIVKSVKGDEKNAR